MLDLKNKTNVRWLLRFPDESLIYVRTKELAVSLCTSVRGEGIDCRLIEEYDLFIKGQEKMKHIDHKEFDKTYLINMSTTHD